MNQMNKQELLFSLFHRAARLMARHRHHRGHPHHAQNRILEMIHKEETMGQKELLELLQIRPASLSELLAKLERNGLIAKHKAEEDKRNYRISLTAEGVEHAAGMAESGNNGMENLFSSLSDEEQEQLTSLLAKLAVTWEEELDAFAGHGPHPHHGHGHHHGRHPRQERGRDRHLQRGHGPHHGNGRTRHDARHTGQTTPEETENS